MAWLPLPSVVGNVDAAGRYVTSQRQVNALQQAELDKKLKEIQNQYAPRQAEADIGSKESLNAWRPAQTIASFLQSPAASNLTKDQYNALKDQFNNAMQRAQSYTPNQPQQSNPMGNGLLGAIVNYYKGKIPGQNSLTQPAPQPAMTSNALNQTMPVPTGSDNKSFNSLGTPLPQVDNNGNPINTSPPQPLSQTYTSSGMPQQTPQDPNAPMGGNNPMTQSEAQAAAIKTGATTFSANEANEWNATHKENKSEAKTAIEQLNNLKSMEDANKNLRWFEQGPFRGNLKAITQSAGTFDTFAKNAGTDLAQSKNKGQITDIQFATGDKLKPNREMPAETRLRSINFWKGFYNRDLERTGFYNEAYKSGLKTWQADELWLKYQEGRPFYNEKTGEMENDNLNTAGDYLTPKMISSVTNNTKLPGKKKTNTVSENIHILDNKKYRRNANGQWETVE